MLALCVVILIQSSILSSNEAAKILAVFPTPSISHQVVFRTLTNKLVQLGHQVTVVTPDPAFSKGKSPTNLKEIDVHDISYKKWTETFMKAPKGRKSDLVKQVEIALKTLAVVVDAQLDNEEVQTLINDKNNTYDLLLLEACVRPALVFSHLFKAPVITVNSFGANPWHYEIIGAPDHPIFYSSILRLRLHNLTIWEKFVEIYNSYQLKNMLYTVIKLENKILKRRFPDAPNIEELSKNIDMLFLNSYPTFGGIRPVPPAVIHMGGLHQKPTKALPADLKDYLDSSENGVIYVSFGTNVDPILLPKNKVQTLVRVFSKLPYNVLFKWDDEKLPGCSNNTKISKWLPQADLLMHPNVKLFITQGGLQSTDEAITAGVPLIGIPMLIDQWHNTENYVRHGIGLQLDFETLTEEQLIEGINHIIADESYRRNIVKLRTLMLDEPMPPLERAVWWIEYVLRHGGAKHLKSPTANMSWSEYLQFHLILVVLLVLILFFIISIVSIYVLYNYITMNIKVKII